MSPRRVALIRHQGYTVDQPDYLRWQASKAPTAIITNPPWGKYSKKKYGAPIALGFTPGDVAERFVRKNLRDLGYPVAGRLDAGALDGVY